MKLNIKKLCAILAGAFTIVSLSSCLEQESSTNLSKDGSGTIVEKTTLGAQMAGMMKQGGEGANEFTDEETYKAKVATMGEGVEFVGLEQKDLPNGGMEIIATYKFADITKLKAAMSDDDPDSGQITFEYEKGDVNKLTVNMPKKAGAKDGEGVEGVDGLEIEEELSDEEKEAQKQQMKMMAGMMAGMRMASYIVVDGEVVKTDADFSEGNKITLFDLDIGKIFSNDEALDKLSSPDDMEDFNTMRELAKSIEGLKIEADDKIVVEFK